MREDEGTGRTERMRRLPGEDERAASGPGYDWNTYGYGPARGDYAGRGSVRERGVRTSRRASTWTAAALIAAVAATTGYLAHSIPAPSTIGTTSTGYGQPGKSTAVNHGAPAVSGPVVTSGGSGVAAGSGAWKGDN